MALAVCFDAGSCEEEIDDSINTGVTGGCAGLSAKLHRNWLLGGERLPNLTTIVPTVSLR